MAKEKVKKVYISVGAPLWMAQFTAVMLILIVFFMILCVLAKDQKGGGRAGTGRSPIGQINALGITIGRGVFRFGQYGHARSFAPNPGQKETNLKPSTDIDLMRGDGGLGNTALPVKSHQADKYFVLSLGAAFAKDSHAVTAKLREELRKFSIYFAMTEDRVAIKALSTEMGDANTDAYLALSRATAIAEELARFGITRDRLSCVGYPGWRYFSATPGAAPPNQENALFVFAMKKKP